jgi:hypothetical protein
METSCLYTYTTLNPNHNPNPNNNNNPNIDRDGNRNSNLLGGEPIARPKLRGISTDSRPVILNPESFTLEGLSYPEDGEFNDWLKMDDYHMRTEIRDEVDAATRLCIASFGLGKG